MSDFVRHPAGVAGAILLTIIALAVLFGPLVAPYDPQAFHTTVRLQGPSADHWLGTDQFGRDLLSRLLFGARSTIAFGVGATMISVIAGSLIGVTAGVVGGWIDSVIMRGLDGMLAVPDLLFVLLIVTMLGAGTGEAMLAVSIALHRGWREYRAGPYCRFGPVNMCLPRSQEGSRTAISFCPRSFQMLLARSSWRGQSVCPLRS